MRVLVTNDDGIESPYIAILAEVAKQFGDVTVIAPKEQQSATSQSITLGPPMELIEYDAFPVEGVKAWSLDGKPADCVRIAYNGFFEKGSEPRLVLSGVNDGSNCGYDTLYSATVACAMEAVLYGAHAVCFSQKRGGTDEVMRKYCSQVAEELVREPLPRGQAWNVNFPGCSLSSYKGILRNRKIAQTPFFYDLYCHSVREDKGTEIVLQSEELTEAEEGTDIRAVLDGYISVGIVTNPAMM